MKTPLQKVIEILKDLHAENDGHTAYQQGVQDCIDICIDELDYERAVIKYIADAQRELYEVTSIELADKNLSVTHFRNGDPISEALTAEEWVEYGKQEIPAFMRNGDDFHYNHYAVTDNRGLTPEGWRIPTLHDMKYIIENKLWKQLPKSGLRYFDGLVSSAGSNGNYWSSTIDGSNAWLLNFNSSYAPMYRGIRALGFSVRCVRNIN